MNSKAAADLRQTSKDLPHIMPFPIMMDVFEELSARYEEEYDELTRQHLHVPKTDILRFSRSPRVQAPF